MVNILSIKDCTRAWLIVRSLYRVSWRITKLNGSVIQTTIYHALAKLTNKLVEMVRVTDSYIR